MCTFILGSRPYSPHPRKESTEKFKKSFCIQESSDVGRATVLSPAQIAPRAAARSFLQLKTHYESMVCRRQFRFFWRQNFLPRRPIVYQRPRAQLVFHNRRTLRFASNEQWNVRARCKVAKVGKGCAMDFSKKLTYKLIVNVLLVPSP
jgi:hypothetical protein